MFSVACGIIGRGYLALSSVRWYVGYLGASSACCGNVGGDGGVELLQLDVGDEGVQRLQLDVGGGGEGLFQLDMGVAV